MGKTIPKYEEEFKKSIVSLHQNGKNQSDLSREYGISLSTISKWVKTYTEVKIDNDTVMTAKQVKALQNEPLLEEENLILKKAIAIFTPHHRPFFEKNHCV
jgi:transposase